MTLENTSTRAAGDVSNTRWVWVFIIPLLALAYALRVTPLNGPRFHPDEALFASFARAIAVSRDPLLAAAPVDKPPLLFYLQALFYSLLGPRELAARIPSLLASTLTVALSYSLTARLAFGSDCSQRHASRPSGAAAAVFTALSPLAVAFGATAFTDSLMVAWGVAALLAAVSDRPLWAGLWLGLGLATKYQAFFFLPLVAGLLWSRRKTQAQKSGTGVWTRLAVGIAGPLVAVAIWELARSGEFSLIGRQAASYGAARLLRSHELWPRLVEWVRLEGYVAPLPWLVLLLAFALVRSFAHRCRPSLLMAAWLLGYLLIHWLLNIHPWDRYLLPTVPVVGVLTGLSIDNLHLRARPGILPTILVIALVLALLPGALDTARGSLPIGGDHGTFEGIEQVGTFFSNYPYGTVLYDHWLSWELRYYLFDSRVFVSWFADASDLVNDLAAFGTDPPRFLVIPAWETPQPFLQVIRAGGFSLDPVLHARRHDGTVSFVVYKITE